MKTLDVHALHDAIDQTLEQLKKQSEEIADLKKSVDGITVLDDALKGKGGDAIRAFYEECHTPFLRFYESFIEEYQSTLKKIKNALNSLEPNHNGYISQAFLDHDLEQGLNAADRTTKNLVSKANATIAKVSHIVDLPDLNDNDFHEHNRKAMKDINQTIEKLHAFDREQTNALKTAENDLETMQRYITRLEKMYTGPKIEITGYQKGSILKPDEMDALRGDQETAMGVMLDKLDKRSKLEKEISEVSEHDVKMYKLKKKLEQLYDDPDEYLKVAKEIGYDNLTSEEMNYVTAIEESQKFRADPIKGTLEDGKHILESMIGFVGGAYDFAKETVVGTVETAQSLTEQADDFLKNPKATVNAVFEYDYKAAFESMLKSIADSWDKQMVNGDSYSRGHYLAYAIGTIWGLAEAGPTVSTGAKSLGKAGKTAAKTAKKGVNSAKRHIKSPINRYVPALEGMLQRAGEVPNVKNTPLLKELLEDKKTSVLFKSESNNNGKPHGSGDTLPALPHVENATIDSRKLTGYALNPDHPVGGNKAKVFESALGYNKTNAHELEMKIKKELPNQKVIIGKLDQYGQRYTVDIDITGPNGKTATVRTGWMDFKTRIGCS
ncbi:LXG domain-containing protein [Bacillus sonorensis]|uniref:ribonuclease YeeF family protein n=1 Tax=Bacillus sonorensis TaxID=119858 RepID=UPI002280C40E|nr:LXG domain-containing protein [Bacillus sonorensis]MCZ0068991.1 LXG domain-containing protein [Bacillus sonorensis]MCZ0096379.1 LXG domain-containing protein [Bacillus sonorensis]MEC1519941.1 LXG domain-containing protein [Bacillus sonorensis]